MRQPENEATPIEDLGTAAELQQYVDSVVANPGLDRLADLAGGETLPAEPRERLQRLREIAAQGEWDRRQLADGTRRTRQELDLLPPRYTENSAEWQHIRTAGEELGSMRSSRPTERNLDVLGVFGGANDAIRDRFEWGMVNSSPKLTVILCSGRDLTKAEQARTRPYAPNATDEYELGRAVVESYTGSGLRPLGETTLPQANGDTWRLSQYRYYTPRGEPRDILVVGSSKTLHHLDGNEYTPTTHSNLEWLRGGIQLHPGMHVGLVTTGLFVPEQGVAAKAVLGPLGVEVETFGHGALYSGAKRTSDQILQDATATLNELAKLQDQIDQMAA